MGGYIRSQPARVVFDEALASGNSLATGITGFSAKSAAIRYLSWTTPLPPSSSARVVAATVSSSNAVTVITSGISNPDYARVVRVVPSTSQLATGNVVVNGTNIWGASTSDTIALGGSGAAVNGTVAFKTITSIVLPASTSGTGTQAAVSVTVGLGNVFGVDRQIYSVASVLRGAVNGTAETTSPTMSVAKSTVSFNTSCTSSGNVELFYLQADMTNA